MTLRFKGNILQSELTALPAASVKVGDAYYVENDTATPHTFSYKYCSSTSGSITWSSYDPMRILKDVVYCKVWACKGAPSAASNTIQFPEVGIGCFALDVSTGDFYGYDGAWQKWTGTAVISL